MFYHVKLNLIKTTIKCLKRSANNDNFCELESALSLAKQACSILLVNMERQCWVNTHYLRLECLEIIFILSEVEADVLEEKYVNKFEKLDCNISSNYIAAFYRVSKKVRQSSSSFHSGRSSRRYSL